MLTLSEETELFVYRCPNCGTYNKPYLIRKDGVACMLCEKCKAEYRTKTSVMKNFRIYSSRLGSKKNRSPTFYNSMEKQIKKILEELGYREGIDFFHNSRIKGEGRSYYWVDFILPIEKIVIEVNGSIWHKIGDRETSDTKKRSFLENIGFTVLEIDEKILKKPKEVKKMIKNAVDRSSGSDEPIVQKRVRVAMLPRDPEPETPQPKKIKMKSSEIDESF